MSGDAYTRTYETITMLCKNNKSKDQETNHDDIINGLTGGLGSSGDIVVGKWKTDFSRNGVLYNLFTKKVLAEPEVIINGFGEHILIPKTHYMCEIFRIPMNDECTLLNVMKLGCYNALLFGSSLREADFPAGIAKTFKSLEMNKLSSYLDGPASFEGISDELISGAISEMVAHKN